MFCIMCIHIHTHAYLCRWQEKGRQEPLGYSRRVGKEIGNFTLPLAIRGPAEGINMCSICVRFLMVERGPLRLFDPVKSHTPLIFPFLYFSTVSLLISFSPTLSAYLSPFFFLPSLSTFRFVFHR